jgi:hypothetical protein
LKTVAQAQTHCPQCPLDAILADLGLPRGTYFRWVARAADGQLADQVVVPHRAAIPPTPQEADAVVDFARSKPLLGYPVVCPAGNRRASGKHSGVKQYFKENRALRTETTVNNPQDFGVGKDLSNWTLRACARWRRPSTSDCWRRSGSVRIVCSRPKASPACPNRRRRTTASARQACALASRAPWRCLPP